MILASLLILTVVGIFYNIFLSSGMNPNSGGVTFGVGCTNAISGPGACGFVCGSEGQGDVKCQDSFNAGCQAAAGSCALSGNSISLLNQQSPFTSLIHGDFTAALPFLTGTAQSQFTQKNLWQVTPFGLQNRYPGACYAIYNANSTGYFGYTPFACWQSKGLRGVTATSPNNVPKNQSFLLPSAPGMKNTTAIHFFDLQVTNSSTYPPTLSPYIQSFACKSLVGTFINGINLGFIAGCQYYATQNHVTSYWYYAIEVNSTAAWTSSTIANGGTRTFNQCNAAGGFNSTQCPNFYFPVVVQPENWDTFDCDQMISFPAGTTFHQDFTPGGPTHLYNPLAVGSITPQCQAIVQGITAFNTSAAQSNAIFGVVLFWLMGIVLFLVSTGISITTSGNILATGVSAGAGSNRQGTKFAQVLGLALVGFVPLYSEFSTWFTSGVLPNGLDGQLGIVSIIIGAVFFAGVFWMATQD